MLSAFSHSFFFEPLTPVNLDSGTLFAKESKVASRTLA